MKCRNCKEEINHNTSDIEDVCFTCVQNIVENYFELREESQGNENE